MTHLLCWLALPHSTHGSPNICHQPLQFGPSTNGSRTFPCQIPRERSSPTTSPKLKNGGLISHLTPSRRWNEHGFPSVHPVIIPVSLVPLLVSASLLPYTELPPCYFPRFPLRPPYRRFRITPSQRSSPQAISHGFPSVHPVVIPVSLLPNGALPKLFPTVSLPSTLSSFRYRSFPPELSPTPCRHSRIAPSHRSSPHAISASLLPTRAFPMLFPTVSPPSTARRLRIAPSHRSSPHAISHGFPSVHPLVASISFLPNGALPKLFPKVSKLLPTVSLLSTSRRFRIAPSHRSSPRANFHGFPPVHPLVAFASLLPTGALPMLISTVSAPSTLSSLRHRSFPPELSPSYFPRFPFRPPCRHSRIAPSHRSSPHANFHGSPPSTLSLLPHRSFPPELSPSYPEVPFFVN